MISTNKFISYLLCNKGIIVNLYKLYFSILPLFFSIKQKSFSPSHFFTLPTKYTRGKTKYFLSFHFFIFSLIFHPFIFPLLQPNRLLRKNRESGYENWNASEWWAKQGLIVSIFFVAYCRSLVCNWMRTKRQLIQELQPLLLSAQLFSFFMGHTLHYTTVHVNPARSKCWENGAVKGPSDSDWVSCLFFFFWSFFSYHNSLLFDPKKKKKKTTTTNGGPELFNSIKNDN